MATLAEVTENERINERHPLAKGDSVTVIALELPNGAR